MSRRVRGTVVGFGVAAAAALAVVAAPREAWAGDASVSVGNPDALPEQARFAEPPPDRQNPIVIDPPPPGPSEPYDPPPPPPSYRETYRAPVRLQLGPVAVTSGRGLGMGLGVGADFGSGTVGARLSAAWTRGEVHDDAQTHVAQLGNGLAQYTGELTLDFHKRGPVHPIFAMGFGLAHVNRGTASGNAGIGTARIGLDYALALEDADVRLGAGVTGVLAGPSDNEVADLRGYALVGGNLSIGF